MPDKETLSSIYPTLLLDTDWFYWLTKDGQEVDIQYPMASSWHTNAPGKPKISEFTATTYAYVVHLKCPEDAPTGWPSDPVTCPTGTRYHIHNEYAGAYEWCEESLNGTNVKHGPYRSWFNRDLRLLMEQGEYNVGEKRGLWIECNRFNQCEHHLYSPIQLMNIDAPVVKNPYTFLEERAAEDGSLVRFFVDLDGDGNEELFVGAKSLIGKSGGIFSIFKKVPGGYMPLGEAFLYPGAFEILPIRHNGLFDLRYCAGVSAEECEPLTFIFNGKEYMRKDFKIPDKNELGSYGYARVNPEESGPALNWKP